MIARSYAIFRQQLLYSTKDNACVQTLLGVSTFERLQWLFGIRPSRREMAVRIFRFIDDNGSGTIHIGCLDVLVKMLQEHLQFSKATFDFLETLRTESENNPTRSVHESDLISFFLTIPNHNVTCELPKDAHWTVFHPDSPSMYLWNLLILVVALYFLWCALFSTIELVLYLLNFMFHPM